MIRFGIKHRVRMFSVLCSTALRAWKRGALCGKLRTTQSKVPQELMDYDNRQLARYLIERQWHSIGLMHESLDVGGGQRCIIELLNQLVTLGFDVKCFLKSCGAGSYWLPVKFAICEYEQAMRHEGLLMACYGPDARNLESAHRARMRLYWVHGYEPAFVHNSKEWRIRALNTYFMGDVYYMANSHLVWVLLDLMFRPNLLPFIVNPGVDVKLFQHVPWSARPGDVKRIGYLDRDMWLRGTDIIGSIARECSAGEYEFCGFSGLSQVELSAAYGRCHLFLDPSRVAGFQMPPLEAMACGTVPIATPYGSSMFLLNGYNGFIVNKDDIGSFVHKIRTAFDEPDVLREMSINARRTAERFSWENTARNFMLNLASLQFNKTETSW